MAFTLGAIVSPTDALAATEITRRLGAPRRIVSIIEGESLVNDGTALVLYKAAIGAAVGGTFSLLDTSGRVVLNVVGGIAIGLAVGWVVRQFRRRLDNPPIEVAIAVLSGYLAYLPADAAGVSGVLAAVTIGVYMGWYTPELTTERTRLSGDAFWEIFVFLVNALVFVLVGLQLRPIVDALSGISSGSSPRTPRSSAPRSSSRASSGCPSWRICRASSSGRSASTIRTRRGSSRRSSRGRAFAAPCRSSRRSRSRSAFLTAA